MPRPIEIGRACGEGRTNIRERERTQHLHVAPCMWELATATVAWRRYIGLTTSCCCLFSGGITAQRTTTITTTTTTNDNNDKNNKWLQPVSNRKQPHRQGHAIHGEQHEGRPKAEDDDDDARRPGGEAVQCRLRHQDAVEHEVTEPLQRNNNNMSRDFG